MTHAEDHLTFMKCPTCNVSLVVEMSKLANPARHVYEGDERFWHKDHDYYLNKSRTTPEMRKKVRDYFTARSLPENQISFKHREALGAALGVSFQMQLQEDVREWVEPGEVNEEKEEKEGKEADEENEGDEDIPDEVRWLFALFAGCLRPDPSFVGAVQPCADGSPVPPC
jgi:hypothetical protein